MFNNLFLTSACATVFVGTLYPLALEALTGEKISVGAPFFNLTFGPLFVPLLIAVPFGPLLAWKRGDLLGAAQRLIWRGRARRWWRSALTFAIQRGGPVLAPFGIGLAVYVMIGALIDPIERVGLFRVPLAHRLRPRARSAALGLGHGGRAFRRRHAAVRRDRREPVERRADRLAEAGRERLGAAAMISPSTGWSRARGRTIAS